MDRKALFADESERFIIPAQPGIKEEVTLRFRTAAGEVSGVYLHMDKKDISMNAEKCKDGFAYYSVKIRTGDRPIPYYFMVEDAAERLYFDRRGAREDRDEEYAFVIYPGFKVPSWAGGAVMYQIFVDRFCNGDRANDVKTDEYSYMGSPVQRAENWDKTPDPLDVRNFYGGDLQGVMDKLDMLEDLGVEVLYLNPVFLSPSNHKYDTQDYEYVDPHFGRIPADGDYLRRITDPENLEAGNALLAELIREAHRRHMRVILDGVFNHCGSFHKWMDKEGIYDKLPSYPPGAVKNPDSPFREYFDFKEDGSFDGWWGNDTLPKLNYENSAALEEYILDIGEKWLSPPYCADGWRLDVAADLGHSQAYNHSFWKKFRKRVKKVNKETLILAEHYGNASPWLQGDEWDTVMNYDAFMEPVSWYLTGMEKHSDQFREELEGDEKAFWDAMRYHMNHLPYASRECAMNELDNHDHSRFLTRTNHKAGRLGQLSAESAGEGIDKDVFRLGVLMQMTWPGAPTIYYGDEAGLVGYTDPDNRRSYPWGREDQNIFAFYKKIIALHKNRESLRRGSLLPLEGPEKTVVFARFTDREASLVCINMAEDAKSIILPAWMCGFDKKEDRKAEVLLTLGSLSAEEKEKILVKGGECKVTLGRKSGILIGLAFNSEKIFEKQE